MYQAGDRFTPELRTRRPRSARVMVKIDGFVRNSVVRLLRLIMTVRGVIVSHELERVEEDDEVRMAEQEGRRRSAGRGE